MAKYFLKNVLSKHPSDYIGKEYLSVLIHGEPRSQVKVVGVLFDVYGATFTFLNVEDYMERGTSDNILELLDTWYKKYQHIPPDIFLNICGVDVTGFVRTLRMDKYTRITGKVFLKDENFKVKRRRRKVGKSNRNRPISWGELQHYFQKKWNES